jgi:hypothetical protein
MINSRERKVGGGHVNKGRGEVRKEKGERRHG